ncbi:MAG: quinone oxidoreductase [Alphaproteobacteria bacterium]|nr:quinone oxidoreductase [Alphaproteobacteria bacterium]
MRTKAIRIYKTGGPEVLTWEETDVGEPGPGEARVRHSAVGLNYIDCYVRTGLYPAQLPATLGFEGAGVVEAIGTGVREVAVGQRVAYATGPLGAYAERRVMPADKLVAVPEGITDAQAAAMMLQGMTAQYLIRRTFPVASGQTILVHAVAGGVGLILCQWAHHLGARVIGTVSTQAKAALARAHGCAHPIVLTDEDFVARVKAITGGAGVPVVYDSVGKDTFMKSLDCLAPLGTMVLFGQSSGPVALLDPAVLVQKGSLFLTRPSLFTYAGAREDLIATANDLFSAVRSGAVRIEVNQTFPLAEAAAAHTALQARRTTGSTVLLP